jgi:hypothetical protein
MPVAVVEGIVTDVWNIQPDDYSNAFSKGGWHQKSGEAKNTVEMMVCSNITRRVQYQTLDAPRISGYQPA